jgi:hypothetical protein
MFRDDDADGVQDAGEIDMYYRIPNPSPLNLLWDSQTNNQQLAVKDFHGNHLFYDVDGDGTLETGDGDRLLYYWINADGSVRGAKANIASRITPVATALAAGIHPFTLEITNTDICGVDATGFSLFDGNDPDSAGKNDEAVKLQSEYLDWLFSSHGATARESTFQPSVGNDGIREKSPCITLAAGESSQYETLRRSRIQALKLITRTVICEVNQRGTVRFGYAQFRFGGKAGDDNGAYVIVPIEDWYEEDGTTPKTYELHGITDTHENHLRRIIANTGPDSQTPLAESLFQIYTYFMPRTADDMPHGRDWEGVENTTPFPVYNYDMSPHDPFRDYDPDVDAFPPNLNLVGGLFVGTDPDSTSEDAAGTAAPDPVLFSCQKNFILFITDGGSSGDDFTDNDAKVNAFFNPDPLIDTNTNRGYAQFLDLIGDHYRIDDGTDTGLADETETTAGTGTQYILHRGLLGRERRGGRGGCLERGGRRPARQRPLLRERRRRRACRGHRRGHHGHDREGPGLHLGDGAGEPHHRRQQLLLQLLRAEGGHLLLGGPPQELRLQPARRHPHRGRLLRHRGRHQRHAAVLRRPAAHERRRLLGRVRGDARS